MTKMVSSFGGNFSDTHASYTVKEKKQRLDFFFFEGGGGNQARRFTSEITKVTKIKIKLG